MNPGFSVAAATIAFADRLHALVADGVPGVRVTMLSPSAASLRTGDALVNLYLFRTIRDANASNADLPTRGPMGRPMASPTLMLQLDYMISFFGDDLRLDPQRLLGLVAGGLNAAPYIDGDGLRAAIAATPWLGAPPADPIDRLRITPLDMPPEATARIWSDFVQSPYQLTQFYTVAPVALAVPLAVAPVLPVRRIGIELHSDAPLIVHDIVNAAAPALPLIGGGTMAIRMADPGQRDLRVELNGVAATGVRAGFDRDGFGVLLVDLVATQPGPLVAGRVTVGLSRTHPGGHGTIARSAPVDTVVVPGLAAAPLFDPAARQVVATMALVVPREARAAMLLFATGGGDAPSVRLACAPRAAAGVTLVASAEGVAPGRYLVAVEIDDVASTLDYADGGYVGPVVTVSP